MMVQLRRHIAEQDRMTVVADHASLQRARPRLLPGVHQRRNDDGELVLLSASGAGIMGVRREEEPVVGLIDGARTVEALLRAGIACTPPVRAMATLALLRRLQVGGLLQGLEEVDEQLIEGRESTTARISRAWNVRIPLPGCQRLLAAGRPLGRRSLVALPWVGSALVVLALVAAAVTGRVHGLLAPMTGNKLPMEVLTIWLAVAACLSWRGLWRGLSFAAQRLPLPSISLRLLAPLVFIDIDDINRRTASREQRLRVASAGLGGSALAAGLLIIAWLLVGESDLRWRLLASVALFVALANSAPYGRGDGFHLIGIVTGIPDLRRRSTAFLLRRSLHKLLHTEAITPLERTYLRVAAAWLGHALLSVTLLVGWLVPNAVTAVARAIRVGADLSGGTGVAAALLGLPLLAFAGVLLVGLAMVVGGAVKQLLRHPKRPAPRRSQRIGSDIGTLTTELAKVPFLAALPADELSTVASGMCREQHDADTAIVCQGETGDRFCFLHSGDADVIYEEESGLRHRVARLTAGDFFGEIALLRAVPRTATVIARTACEVLTLDRETFVALVERSRFAREAILDQVRNAAFLRQVRVFSHLNAKLMGLLLDGATVQCVGADETVVREGDDGDAMYVLREGRCEVARASDDDQDSLTIGELQPGDWFGEISVLRGVERTATVRSLEGCTLIRVPADVLDRLLMEDLATGFALEQTVARRLVALQTQ